MEKAKQTKANVCFWLW